MLRTEQSRCRSGEQLACRSTSKLSNTTFVSKTGKDCSHCGHFGTLGVPCAIFHLKMAAATWARHTWHVVDCKAEPRCTSLHYYGATIFAADIGICLRCLLVLGIMSDIVAFRELVEETAAAHSIVCWSTLGILYSQSLVFHNSDIGTTVLRSPLCVS